MKIIDTEKHVIKSWCENPEESALAQARNLANLPFLFRQVCLMPDTHLGYGMPIGGVVATQGVVMPNAVGVDIGCGMIAVRTSLRELPVEKLKKIMGEIRKAIPVGFGHHKTAQPHSAMPPGDFTDKPIVQAQYESAQKQVGTLGGGNHFIEIQRSVFEEDSDPGYIWLMIHSGSRNIGFQVAKHYNKMATKFNEDWFSSVPTEWGLSFFPNDSRQGKTYLGEMNYCLDFAFKNRELMMDRVKEIVGNEFNCRFELSINIHHNYAAMEHHFGKNVMIHRKGATSARKGEFGIIPGSQGTASYIVRGKGNADSFTSCSHGAGRRMGRKQAQRELVLANEQASLDKRGILHSIRGVKDLDEASGAYKDIDVVMREQQDLVDIMAKLEPLGVIKG